MAEAMFQRCATITDRSPGPGGEDEIMKLKTILEFIRSEVNDLKNRQVNEAVVQDWLKILGEILYKIDGLDTRDTALLQGQIDRERPDITFEKIKELNKKLGEINRKEHTYWLKTEDFIFKARKKRTSYSPLPFEVFGQDEDIKAILSKLTLSSYNIISIVGRGGSGKTTLALRVYNHEDLKKDFRKRIWVCVSGPFNQVKVAKSIAKSLDFNAPELTELQHLLEYIEKTIEGKKFMLVLEDVWTEDSKDLGPLLSCLQAGGKESKVLVTTQNLKFAPPIGSTFTHYMKRLPEEESWNFCRHTGGLERCDTDKNLEDIGKSIAKKCQGLPLALEIIGSHLGLKTTETEWHNVLNSEMWELEPAKEELIPPPMPSRCGLPLSLKPCFSYCAVFPKNVEIKPKKLIKLWMVQGYLRIGKDMETTGTDMETTGQEYFQHLVSRSFFQDFEWVKYDGSIKYCKMHDIVHDIAQFLAKNECISIDDRKEQHPNTSSSSDKKFRQLRISNATDLDISATLHI